MTEMLNNLAERMITKIRIVNTHRRFWAKDKRRFTESRPFTKIDHELTGMEHALKAMGIPFEYDFDDEVVEITAVTIMGNRYEI